MTKNTIKVKLFWEDLFFSQKEQCPILEQSCQNWCETWFNLLNPSLPQANTYELSLRLTDDLEITKFNSQFRYKNQSTDVLSFAALEVKTAFNTELEPETLYLGDIIISVETAQRQAQKQKHSLTIELGWLISHGFLHLIGWDHPDEESLTKMLAQQGTLLKAVSLI